MSCILYTRTLIAPRRHAETRLISLLTAVPRLPFSPVQTFHGTSVLGCDAETPPPPRPKPRLARCAPARSSSPCPLANLLQTRDLVLLALGLLTDGLGVVRGGEGGGPVSEVLCGSRIL